MDPAMTSTTNSHSPVADDHASHGLAHIMPVRVLVGIFVALVLLTVLTVAATYFPTGSFEIWISLGIATVKASLVAAYFMHLRYDNPLNAVLFVFGLMFIALFLGLTLMDTHQYQGDLIMNQFQNS
jgi:cytochrome c oxidase subunit 4